MNFTEVFFKKKKNSPQLSASLAVNIRLYLPYAYQPKL